MPMTAREAIRLTKKMGGRFVRHGARHDIFANAAGEELPIPGIPEIFRQGSSEPSKKS